eukprot:TRINITY_DN32668_c0_g1_i1.p1 TRINITY_DN32668_c0_g1~~TRINITY_DN32668_c0_g1_i1.p1  ORF type:complete len:456 (-),score=60.24 TRINITY_DN32668_c0_g1_i1:178-1395(-)
MASLQISPDTRGLLNSEAEAQPSEAHPDNKTLNDIVKCLGLLPDKIGWDAHTYGFLTLSIVRVYHAGRKNFNLCRPIFHLLMTLLLYGLCIFVQLAITSFLFLSAERMEHTVEDKYFEHNYQLNMLTASAKLREAAADSHLSKFTKSGEKLQCDPLPGNSFLCICEDQLKVQLPSFYYLMVGVWVVRMVQEMRACVWWTIHITGATLPVGDEEILVALDDKTEVPLIDQDLEDLEGDATKSGLPKKLLVRRLPRTLKAILVVANPLMRFVIACLLLMAGSKYLILQTDQSKLVLKVLCMQFVLQVGDFIFKAMVTKANQLEIKDAKLQTRYGLPSRNSWWENGMGSFAYLLLVVLIVVFLIRWVFYKLLFFRGSCRLFRSAFPDAGLLQERKDLWHMLGEIVNLH